MCICTLVLTFIVFLPFFSSLNATVWSFLSTLLNLLFLLPDLRSPRPASLRRRLFPVRRLQPGVGGVQPAGSVRGLRSAGGAAGAFSLLPDSLPPRQHPRPAGRLQPPADSGHSAVLPFSRLIKKTKQNKKTAALQMSVMFWILSLQLQPVNVIDLKLCPPPRRVKNNIW